MNVHKFGGTSMGDGARIGRAADLVLDAGGPAVVVVSAMAGVTDRLAALIDPHRAGDAHRIGTDLVEVRRRHLEAAAVVAPDAGDRSRLENRIDALCRRVQSVLVSPPAATGAADPLGSARLTDEVVTTGEDLSAELMAGALRTRGARARVVDARRLIRTDASFGCANPVEEVVAGLVEQELTPLLDDDEIAVVQGFSGATVNGVTTTLGRGGSDFTAAILGTALGVPEVHIWTDVPGILSADPGAVDGAQLLAEVGFEEAVELAYFGARVIHPRAARWAVSRGVDLRVRNSFDPEGHETRIRFDRRGSAEVAAVAYKPGVVLIKVRSHPTSLPYGFLAQVFEVLSRHRLPVDLVATSHSSTAFTLDQDEDLGQVNRELSRLAEVEVVRDLATVTVVGHGLMEEPGVNGRVFEAVGTTPVHLISQASDVSVSFLVDRAQAPAVVHRIHEKLIRHRNGSEEVAGRGGVSRDGEADAPRDAGGDTPGHDAGREGVA